MEKPEVSIIIPTRHRAELLKKRLSAIVKATPEFNNGVAELIFAIDTDDKATEQMLKRFKLCEFQINLNAPLEIPASKWNRACRIARGEWLVTMSDDSVPQPNWLKNALKMDSLGFIGLPDGVTGERNKYFTPLYMATRKWLRKYNGGVLVIPKYKSWYADIETANRAHRSGTYMVSWDSPVNQLHAIFNSAPNDEIYRIGEMRRAEDLGVYNLRASQGFPDDFEGVL